MPMTSEGGATSSLAERLRRAGFKSSGAIKGGFIFVPVRPDDPGPASAAKQGE